MADRILAKIEYTNKLAVRVDVGLYSDDQVVANIATVTESIDYLQTKFFYETVEVTDDLNGASPGDDQTFSFSKGTDETPAVGDVFARNVQYVRYLGDDILYWPSEEDINNNLFPGLNWPQPEQDDDDFRDYIDAPKITDSKKLTLTKSFSDSVGAADGAPFIQRVLANADTINVSESYVGDVTLVKDDSAALSESHVSAFTGVYAETVSATEEEELKPSKGPSDSSGVSDAYAASLTKGLSEAPGVSEDAVLSFTSVHTEAPSLAESFSFELSRAFSDNGAVSESAVLSYSKNPSEAPSATDTGYMLSQDYCGIDYFSDDYVGIKRTFT